MQIMMKKRELYSTYAIDAAIATPRAKLKEVIRMSLLTPTRPIVGIGVGPRLERLIT
jgi:hypothetical protein